MSEGPHEDKVLTTENLIAKERRYSRTQERQYARWIKQTRELRIIEKVRPHDVAAISQPVIVKKKARRL